MFLAIVFSILIAAGVGLVAKFFLDKKNDRDVLITWPEYIVVLTIISALIVPGSIYLGWKLAKENRTIFHEYWNGWELEVQKEDISCYRDGPCRQTYDCDPYIVAYSCNCDSKGNCDTCYRTEYHQCPYATVESSYYVETTLGTYTIDTHRLPVDPQNHRWRKHKNIPADVIERAGVGEPPFWTGAKNRINSGYPGPVTQKREYKNYIYASDQSILKQYHDAVKKYEAEKLFPAFQKNIHSFYYADKVYFVGFDPRNSKSWNFSLSYANAAFASVQSDMHLVFVNTPNIADFEEYVLALKAYWQDKERHSRDAMSKNSIVVVCETDGQKIKRARAFTGMPMGNEYMITAMENRLKGADLDPVKIIGSVRGKLNGKKVTNEAGNGLLVDIVFGFSEPVTKFKRVSMVKKDADDNGGGFLYLASEIQPTTLQKAGIYIATFIFCCIGWFVAALWSGRKNYGRRYS